MEDDLRSEYDLKSLRVRLLCSGRKSFGGTTVRLQPDALSYSPLTKLCISHIFLNKIRLDTSRTSGGN
jgi:hypothetical protein